MHTFYNQDTIRNGIETIIRKDPKATLLLPLMGLTGHNLSIILNQPVVSTTGKNIFRLSLEDEGENRCERVPQVMFLRSSEVAALEIYAEPYRDYAITFESNLAVKSRYRGLGIGSAIIFAGRLLREKLCNMRPEWYGKDGCVRVADGSFRNNENPTQKVEWTSRRFNTFSQKGNFVEIPVKDPKSSIIRIFEGHFTIGQDPVL